jgi:DNA (cytosine-5)-methyltransferase 1
LAQGGYDCQWDVISAESVGAPHLRERVFIVGYASGVGCGGEHRGRAGSELENGCEEVAHAERDGLQGFGQSPKGEGTAGGIFEGGSLARAIAEGIKGSDWWAIEPDVGRVAHGVSNRVHRLRALGNAVVPQVAEVVGYMILEWLE